MKSFEILKVFSFIRSITKTISKGVFCFPQTTTIKPLKSHLASESLCSAKMYRMGGRVLRAKNKQQKAGPRFLLLPSSIKHPPLICKILYRERKGKELYVSFNCALILFEKKKFLRKYHVSIVRSHFSVRYVELLTRTMNIPMMQLLSNYPA